MNTDKLKLLQLEFLSQYREGFNSEELKEIGKKHNLFKHVDYIHNTCSKDNLNVGIGIIKEVVKVVTNSSMVSVFEKMKFRDLIKEFDDFQKHELLGSIFELIHGDEEEGFNRLVGLLDFYKLAKWPLISVWRAYYKPHYDVFIKPTTVKKVIKHLEINDIIYSPKPTYEFYKRYREHINEMKELVDERLKVSNPAFSGFLMMTIQ